MFKKKIKSIDVIIIAAGKGNRMYSNIPKVLHTLSEKSLIQYIIEKLKNINDLINHKYIYIFSKEKLKKFLKNETYINKYINQNN